tara:strand:- start:18 stop:341 length:324 start_codon:yes stop_codon:yes gene_type:complete
LLRFKMKKINFLLLFFTFLYSCGSLKEAGKVIRNEKVKTTDEFLVKKRNPLVLPPNHEEIPKPGSIKENKQNEEDKLKKILKAPEKKKISSGKSSSTENSILKKIRE